MIDRVTGALRGADPARSMPAESTAIREATRESILSSGAEKTVARAQTASQPTRHRRLVVVALAAVLLVAVVTVGGAWAYESYFVDRQTVLEYFQAAQADFSLPPGVHWKKPNLPTDSSYGTTEGWNVAWFQSSEAWLREWLAARDANDASRKQAAAAAMDRIVSVMRLHKDGEDEMSGGFDQNGIDLFRSMVAAAKRGDFSEIEYYLKVNYDYAK